MIPQLFQDLYCMASETSVHVSALIMLLWLKVVIVGGLAGHHWLGHHSEHSSRHRVDPQQERVEGLKEWRIP